MSLSSDLISEFVKVTKDDEKPKSETIVYGTTVVYEGSTYVKLDGSELLTPVSTTSATKNGERVTVMIKDHTATITGNMSSPSARSGDVEDIAGDVKGIADQISEFEIVVAGKVETSDFNAEKARIDNLIVENAKITEKLTAAEGEIDTLQANDVTITEKLTAAKGQIEDLYAKKIDATDVQSTYATIENLEATNARVYNFETAYAKIDDLEAQYAKIDFANINEAAITKIYAEHGIIDDLIFKDGRVVGELVGVRIKGDLIEAGTLKADKLVVKGSDGLYYKLNIEGGATVSEQVSDEDLQNGLSGDIIVAKSIAAEKVAVDDLVAFGATIGGFHITKNSIYSGLKAALANKDSGIYLDKEGQLSIGDGNDYLRYFKDENGKYKLEVSASSILMKVGSEASEKIYEVTKSGDTYTKTSNVLYVEPANSTELGVTTTTGETVYSYVDSDGSTVKYYCKHSSVYSVLEDTIGSVETNINYLKERTEYISVGTDDDNNPYIELGKKDSDFKLRITNEKLELHDGSSTPAYISNQKLMIKKAEVIDELRFGNFVWTKRPNGNMGLIWGEENS